MSWFFTTWGTVVWIWFWSTGAALMVVQGVVQWERDRRRRTKTHKPDGWWLKMVGLATIVGIPSGILSWFVLLGLATPEEVQGLVAWWLSLLLGGISGFFMNLTEPLWTSAFGWAWSKVAGKFKQSGVVQSQVPPSPSRLASGFGGVTQSLKQPSVGAGLGGPTQPIPVQTPPHGVSTDAMGTPLLRVETEVGEAVMDLETANTLSKHPLPEDDS